MYVYKIYIHLYNIKQSGEDLWATEIMSFTSKYVLEHNIDV